MKPQLLLGLVMMAGACGSSASSDGDDGNADFGGMEKTFERVQLMNAALVPDGTLKVTRHDDDTVDIELDASDLGAKREGFLAGNNLSLGETGSAAVLLDNDCEVTVQFVSSNDSDDIAELTQKGSCLDAGNVDFSGTYRDGPVRRTVLEKDPQTSPTGAERAFLTLDEASDGVLGFELLVISEITDAEVVLEGDLTITDKKAEFDSGADCSVGFDFDVNTVDVEQRDCLAQTQAALVSFTGTYARK